MKKEKYRTKVKRIAAKKASAWDDDGRMKRKRAVVGERFEKQMEGPCSPSSVVKC